MDMLIGGLSEVLEKGGLGACLAFGVFILAYFMMRHILKMSNDLVKMSQQDHENWSATVNNHMASNTKALAKVNENLDKSMEKSDRGREYVRKEHERILGSQTEMVKTLIEMNASKT